MNKKVNKLLECLENGQIPERLHLVHWRDITQIDGSRLLNDVKQIEFMSVGLIIEKTKKYIKLQQTWELRDDKLVTDRSANIMLMIPTGVIEAIYNFDLDKSNLEV